MSILIKIYSTVFNTVGKNFDKNWHKLLGKPYFFILMKWKQYHGKSGIWPVSWIIIPNLRGWGTYHCDLALQLYNSFAFWYWAATVSRPTSSFSWGDINFDPGSILILILSDSLTRDIYFPGPVQAAQVRSTLPRPSLPAPGSVPAANAAFPLSLPKQCDSPRIPSKLSQQN